MTGNKGFRVLDVEGLGIRAGGRELFSGAGFSLDSGRIALVAGPSGSGKTMLLRALCGLPPAEGVEVTGLVRVHAADGAPGRPGMVFQDHALFDDFTPEENIRFGADHSRVRRSLRQRREIAASLASALEIPAGVPVSAASTGQRQRIALARTLAFDADLVLFDEPTSGLDPRQSRRVAELVKRTTAEFGRAAVVVTHDYVCFREIADVILLLDPSKGAMRAATPGELDAFASSDEPLKPAPAAETGLLRRLLGAAAGFFDSTACAVIEALLIPLFALPLWRSPRWGAKFFARYAALVAFPSTIAYMAIAGLIAGVVTTYFTFEYFPFRRYTEPIILDDILGALGYALYRIIVPALVALLVAARCGAAAAADVGGRVYSRQTDAMASFGVSPRRYIYTNLLLAFLLGVPVLTAAGFAAARLASLAVFVYMHPDSSPLYWSHHFHSQLDGGGLFYDGTGWLACKMWASAACVAAVSYLRGMSPKPSAVSVNSGITSAVIRGTLLVLAVQAGFAFLEFAGPGTGAR